MPLLATLWLEAESAEARALIGSETIQAIEPALLEPLRRKLLNCWHGRYQADRAGELVDEAIARLRSQPTPTRTQVDARVERARELLRSAPGGRATLAEVAGAVGLSHSRLTHLFSEQLGLPPGRYLIWVRLRRALEALSSGASVVDAAHASGFADGPHLSRTFREMLGFPPSAALQVSRFVHARASETE